jgi:hypothetical protein
MILIKETKKYKVYEVEFGLLGKVTIKDPMYYENKFKMKTGERYLLLKFEHSQNGTKSQCECDQSEPLDDIKRDIERIRKFNITGTNFYSNWMKLFFNKGEEYTVVKSGIEIPAIYNGQDTFKKNTHYFLISGEKVVAGNLKYKGFSL